jgi:hypothetical protein
VTAANTDGSSDTSGTLPDDTTTKAECLILMFASGSGPDTGGTAEYTNVTNGNLSSISEMYDNSVATVGGSSKAAWKGTLASAGAIGAGTYTKSNAATKAHLVVAVAPPAVAVPPPSLVAARR